MQILNYIGTGYNNAVPREHLVSATGLSDRKIRREIERARREGFIIINRQDGKGYYISNSSEDILKQYKQNNSRAMAILVQQKHLRRRLKAEGIEVQ